MQTRRATPRRIVSMIHCFDEFEFDADKLELRRAGQPIKADAQLLRILSVLVRSPGDLITKQEIVLEVWQNRAISDNALSVSMARLRKLLGHQRGGREIVLNVHGRGFRFVRAVTPRDAPLGPVLSARGAGRSRRRARLAHALGSDQQAHRSVWGRRHRVPGRLSGDRAVDQRDPPEWVPAHRGRVCF